MARNELLSICIRVTRILGIQLGIAGAIIVGIWGFPFTCTAVRVNQSAGEAAPSWIGFSCLLVGFALQLRSEWVDLWRERLERREV
jgi:hypothetical protein